MSDDVKGEVLRGVVKWFNNAKGFGFIEHTTGKDVFVHYSVIEQDGYRSLKDGEEVEYEIKEGPKGFHATRVSRLNPPASADSAGEGAADSSSQSEDSSHSADTKTPLSSNIERIQL